MGHYYISTRGCLLGFQFPIAPESQMEVPPSRRRIRHSPPPPPPAQGCTGGDDLISTLPDDMLLQILTRLGCARAAARTAILARRWRNLWIHLPGLIFRDVPAGKVQAALTRVARRRAGMSISTLDIRLARSVPPEAARHDDALAKKLLRKAVRLSPEEVIFVLPQSSISKPGRRVEIAMPCFLRATSIELDTYFLQIQPPENQILPALERLSISGNIVDIDACLNQCPRLRVLRVTFRGVSPVLLEESLTALEAVVALGLTVSLLRIELELYNGGHTADGAQFASLLHAAARVSPQELVLVNSFNEYFTAELPCFPRTKSIEMWLYSVCFTHVTEDKFLALERLSLQRYRCTILDLDTMVSRCPRLRVLKVNANRYAQDVTIRSTSLQELELSVDEGQCEGIDIETPLLTQLKLSVDVASDINMSIWAPMVEKVSYWFSYKKLALMFGFWSLQSLRVDTIENYKYKDEGLTKEGKDACSLPPRVHVLCLQISARDQSGPVLNFARELEKLPVSNFTILALNLNAEGHVLAAFVSRILGMHHLQTSIQRLKVVLCNWSEMSKCVKHCPCNEPKNWRSYSISLTRLEEVEIYKFRGGDHEIDLVTMILSWAPMLTRMTIRLTHEINPSDIGDCAKSIYRICFGHTFVNSFVYLSNGELVPCSQM
ncbi:hypothetical protein ACQJBY_034880 [Aegilops geniculata]